MHDFFTDSIELLKAVAWPVTVLIALGVLRSQIQTFLTKLSDSIGHAAQISIGKKGLEIKLDNKIAAVNSRIAAVNAAQDQVTETVYKNKRRQQRGQTRAKGALKIPVGLRELADAYLAVNEPDSRTRVLRKNELALQMGDFVIREDISRDLLAREKDEALHLALAAAVAADPEHGDLERMCSVAPTTARLHVRYKFVVALISLINKGFVQEKDVPAVRDALRRLAFGADEPLQRIISDAGSLLDAVSLGELTISS
jgi:hypothetical protein